jgi:hypothetical protein
MTALVWPLTLVLVLVASAWIFQRSLIYFPTTSVPAPASLGLRDVDEVTVATGDGLELKAWFLRAEGPVPRPAVVVFNGNAGNRAYRAPLGSALRRLGVHVLLTDYRGYGGNPGRPTEPGLALDGRAALAWITSRPDVDQSHVVYFGESLGTAVAIALAADAPPAALILRSPFTSLADIGAHHYRLLPVRWLLMDRFDCVDRIGRVRAPVLVIAGSRDAIVPLAFSERLHAAARPPKTMLVIPDADHNDAELLAGNEMMRGVTEFLEPLLAP